MKYVIQIGFVLIALGMFACKSSEAEKELNAMHNQIMDIHDEVMPKMSDINKLKKNLTKNFSDDQQAQDIVKQLDIADESMMEWMHQYDKPNYDNVDAAEKYYSGQLEKVTKVKENMLTSIKNAQQYIAKDE